MENINRHSENCDLLDRVKHLQRGSWKIGEGEVSGYVDVEDYGISFSDGLDGDSIPFNFCPICGVKLEDFENEQP